MYTLGKTLRNYIRSLLLAVFIFLWSAIHTFDPQHLNMIIHTLWSEYTKKIKKNGGKKNEKKEFG